MPILFPSLSLAYGIAPYDPLSFTKSDAAILARQFYRNEAILRRVESSPGFARAVRSISVCWYQHSYPKGLYDRHLSEFLPSSASCSESLIHCRPYTEGRAANAHAAGIRLGRTDVRPLCTYLFGPRCPLPSVDVDCDTVRGSPVRCS